MHAEPYVRFPVSAQLLRPTWSTTTRIQTSGHAKTRYSSSYGDQEEQGLLIVFWWLQGLQERRLSAIIQEQLWLDEPCSSLTADQDGAGNTS